MRHYDDSEIDTVYVNSVSIPCKDKQHKEWFTCGKNHAGHVLRLLKRDDGSPLSFVCEYNHFVEVLTGKQIVGLDKYHHGGWLTDKSIKLREERDAEAKALFERATIREGD
jgi:hypothetical protein